MSDLLAGLRSMVPDRRYALDELTGTQAYEWALNDVREALRNPTDDQVNAIGRVTECVGRLSSEQIRAVLAAAAGGDDA